MKYLQRNFHKKPSNYAESYERQRALARRITQDTIDLLEEALALEVGDDYPGVTNFIEELVWLVNHSGGDDG